MMLWREKESRLWVSTGELCKKYKIKLSGVKQQDSTSCFWPCMPFVRLLPGVFLGCDWLDAMCAPVLRSELCLAFSKQEMQQYFNDTFSWKLPSVAMKYRNPCMC